LLEMIHLAIKTKSTKDNANQNDLARD